MGELGAFVAPESETKVASAAQMFIRIGAQTSQETKAITGMSNQINQFAGGSLANATSGAERLTGAIGTGARVAAGFAAGGIVAAGVGLLAGAKAGLGFNNSMEQVTAQLNAFTKDGKQSAKILDMIKDRAARTPFAFEEMAAATAGLMGSARLAGKPLVDLVGQAEILAASNPAQGLEGAAFAIREAVSGDFQSVIERFGLPRTMINDLKKEGVPALEIVSRAMQSMGYDADLVSNMAETASGRWSTFKDTLMGFAGTASEGLFKRLSSGLGDINKMLSDPAVIAGMDRFAKMIGGQLTAAFNWLVNTGVPSMISGFNRMRSVVSAVAGPFIDAWNAFQTWRNFGGITMGLSAAFAVLLPRLTTFGANVVTWILEQAPIWATKALAWGVD